MSGALLLGAGFSRRFGSDKRRHLVTLPDGSRVPMLCATAGLYARVFVETVVVVRVGDEDLSTLLARQAGVRTVVAADAAGGMGHSLAAGIRAVSGWSYAFVGLGDMPFVRPETLRELRTTMERCLADGQRSCILQPWHDGRPGHPVGFGAPHFAALAALTGDEGARRVLRDAHHDLVRLEVDDPGVLQDVDEPP